jgi:hypothetical protein
MVDVEAICSPTPEWIDERGGDTPEQAQLRACLIAALEGLDPLDQIRVGRDLVNVMRDQLMRGAADVRRAATAEARRTLSPSAISAASGASGPTVSRLLTRARTRAVGVEPEDHVEAS